MRISSNESVYRARDLRLNRARPSASDRHTAADQGLNSAIQMLPVRSVMLNSILSRPTDK